MLLSAAFSTQFDPRKPGKVTLVQRLSLIVASAESCFISGDRPLPTPTTFVLLWDDSDWLWGDIPCDDHHCDLFQRSLSHNSELCWAASRNRSDDRQCGVRAHFSICSSHRWNYLRSNKCSDRIFQLLFVQIWRCPAWTWDHPITLAPKT